MVAKKAAKKDVVVKDDQVPDYIRTDAQRGSENVTQRDLLVPRLTILQALSPEVDEDGAAYVPGARPGYLVNTLTKQMWSGKDGVLVVPVVFDKQHMVWREREEGGGLLGVYDTAEEAQARLAMEGGEAANVEYVETPQHICFVLNDDGSPIEEIAIPMPKSKYKISRRWNSLIRINGGDRFSRAYRIRSVKDKGPKGEFYNFEITNAGWASKDAYEAAEDLYEAIMSGRLKVQAAADEERSASDRPAF